VAEAASVTAEVPDDAARGAVAGRRLQASSVTAATAFVFMIGIFPSMGGWVDERYDPFGRPDRMAT